MRGAAVRLDALTGVRCFAALHIVAYHFATSALDHAPDWIKRLQQGGTGAVSLFFLLSGFVLAYNYGDAFAAGRISWRRFMRQRLARIYPLYAVAALIAIPLQMRTGLAPSIAVGAGALHLAGLQAWIPQWMWQGNGPGWCISVELFFYVLFPFLVNRLFTRPLARVWFVEMAAWWMLAFVIAWLPAWLHARGPLDLFLQNAPPMRLPELILGLGLGKRFAARDARRPMTAGLIAASAALLLVEYHYDALPISVVHMVALLPLMGVVWGLACGGPIARLVGGRTLCVLGETSFAIYLLQEPLFLAVGGTYDWTPDQFLRYLVLLLIVSGFAYAAIERPAQAWLGGAARLPSLARPLLTTTVMLVVAGVVSTDCSAPRAWRGATLGARRSPTVDESGFWGQEWDGGKPFRWTNGHARLRIPLDGGDAPRAVELVLATALPEGTRLEVLINGQSRFAGRVTPSGLVDRFAIAGGYQPAAEIELNSDTIVPHDRWPSSHDTRALGVRVDAVRLQ